MGVHWGRSAVSQKVVYSQKAIISWPGYNGKGIFSVCDQPQLSVCILFAYLHPPPPRRAIFLHNEGSFPFVPPSLVGEYYMQPPDARAKLYIMIYYVMAHAL